MIYNRLLTVEEHLKIYNLVGEGKYDIDQYFLSSLLYMYLKKKSIGLH